jgi:hypothetical protein
MVILVLGAFVTIAFAPWPWAQSVRTSIAKHAPEIAMDMIDHITKHPKVPKV